MNFTITLNGEGPELASALQVLRGVMDGQAVVSGKVSATIASPQPQYEAPTQQQPVYQPPQYEQQQAPVYQQPVYQQPQYEQPQQNQQAQQGYQPQQTQQQPTQAGGVPLSQPTAYTMDHLSVAATQLMDAGRQPELVALLASFGVPALTMLPKEHFGSFATALRGMGAKI